MSLGKGGSEVSDWESDLHPFFKEPGCTRGGNRIELGRRELKHSLVLSTRSLKIAKKKK